MARARHARTRRPTPVAAAALLGVLVASLALGSGATSPPAAAEEPGAGTTQSARTLSWADQNPRHPDDGAGAADPAPYQALKDLKLRVSQTADLLNQTVEVSWQGLPSTGKEAFLQLMQCWSDGPSVPPTREQCAYGGVDSSGLDGTGLGRTRQLDVDPREKTYFSSGDLNPVSVDGAVAPKSWSEQAEVVLGTNQQACPADAAGYAVTLVPPRAVVEAGSLPGSVVLEDSPSTRPASLTRTENGSPRTYATVTSALRLSTVAAAHSLPQLPLGLYRFQLACTTAAGVEVARFVGYLDKAEVNGSRVWRRGAHAGGVSVPFDPLGDTPDTAATDAYEREQVLEYLKPRTTNEVWQALSRADGGGSVFMEVLTDLEAQHLGCGRVDSAQVRSCWLVAVPRWGREPNGASQESAALYSPLSQTLWDRRIEVPLSFAPVAAGCRIGSGLKQVLAHDSALNVLRSWQPTFCGDSSTAASVLGPLQDFSIRGGVSKPNRMGVVTVPPEDVPTLVRAPLATSAVVVAFALDRQIAYGQPDFELNATRVATMNLNPRLVAKMLTQSYDSGAAPNGGKTTGFNSPERSGGFRPTFAPARRFPAGNPRTMYDDPEFLGLNPEIASWLAQAVPLPPMDMSEILVSFGDTDAYQVLWQWIVGDPAAKAFLAGTPDANGMRVNPYYQDQVTSATSSFPQLDPTCMDDIEDPKADAFPMLCQINNHPRVEDDAKAAQAAVRGDTRRVNVAPPLFTGAPGEILSYTPEPRQQQGKVAMVVITTSANAARYGLPTARLRNAAGEFVSPTTASMTTARDQMTVRADGVLLPAPATVRSGGYPLTTNSYAMVDVAATSQSENNAFAAILDYAAGSGQRPGTAVGQLPPGYAPLSPALVTRTRTAAALLRNPASLLAETPVPSAAPAPTAGGGDGPADPVAGPPQGFTPVGSPSPAAGPSAPLLPAAKPPVAALVRTSTPRPAMPWTVPALLTFGLVCAVAGRVLRLLGKPAA